MKTFEEKSIVVRFHIGRGGRFHNSGYKVFIGKENLQDVIRSMSETATIISEDENGNELPRNEWKLIYHDKVVLEGEEIEAETGVIDVDGTYNTDICRYIEDCTDEELELIWKSIEVNDLRTGCLSQEDLRQAVSELLDRPILTKVKMYSSNAEIFTTLNGWSIQRDKYCNLTPDEVIESLMDEYGLMKRDAEWIEGDMEIYEWIEGD